MTDEEKKEYEEFLKWKKKKSNLAEDKMPDNKEFVQQVRPPQSGWKPGCGLGCLTVLVIMIIFALSSKSGDNKGESDVVDWTEASVMSEQFVKGFMKFPDNVNFIKESRNVNEEGDGVFKITGRLKANNTFGQAIPYTYNVRIRYNGGDWTYKSNWSFMGGNLYNESTQEFTELE